MLDVDQHVRVDLVEGAQELGPVGDVVPLAQGDEVPGGRLGPLVGPLVATEVGARLVGRQTPEAVVEHPVERRVLGVDADVLGGGVEDQLAEVPDDRDGVHLLPEQMRGVQLDAHMGRAGEVDEPVHVRGVEHDILRVQFQGDLDVVVTGEPVGLAPEVRDDLPLVVQHVQGRGVPRVDDPVRAGRAGLAAGQTRHGHEAVLSEPFGQPDGAADVLGVLLADDGVRVERVAIGVQASDGDAGALEETEEVVPGGVADQDVVEGRHMHGREETTGVDLDARQAQIGDDLDRLRKRPVVQDRVVETQLHLVFPQSFSVVTAVRAGEAGTLTGR